LFFTSPWGNALDIPKRCLRAFPAFFDKSVYVTAKRFFGSHRVVFHDGFRYVSQFTGKTCAMPG
jgi:hypothetical protein